VITLVTDFGVTGPYQGQMHAALLAAGNRLPVIDLLHDAPRCNPRAAAYLLAATAASMPIQTLFVAIIDPGVGGSRQALILYSAGNWYVGPDNGVLSQVVTASAEVQVIDWLPDKLSNSFHGRDLFAPVAAMVGCGQLPDSHAIEPGEMVGSGWPRQLAEIIYLDPFGNAFTGLPAVAVPQQALLQINDRQIAYAKNFCRVAVGTPFWYVNSNQLVEIAVNGGSAAHLLGLQIGTPLMVERIC